MQIRESGEESSGSSQSSGESTPCAMSTEVAEPAIGEPQRKRFRHLERVLEQKWKEGLRKKSKLPHGQAEVERFFESLHSLADNADPFAFWLDQASVYPLLSPVAIDVLAIPASSAPVERVFSTAGESTTGKRNRLSDHNLEREVLLRKNRHFL